MIRQAITKWLGVEQRSYTELALAAAAARAGGTASAACTGVAEACAGLWERSLAAATVAGADVLTPALLGIVGRALFCRGECLLVIRTNGGLRLEPAASWDIQGSGADETEWAYTVQIAGPSDTREERIPGPGVLHFRYAMEPESPWCGRSPIALAGVSADVLALVESTWDAELSGTFGYLLALPRAKAGDTTIDELRAALGAAKGGLVTAETVMGGWGGGRIDSPQREYAQRRFGAEPPAELREIRKELVPAILSAAGIPIELIRSADGAGMRESWRRYVLSTVAPLGALVAAEATAKLERPVTLKFESLRGSDHQGLSRAIKALVDSGMSLPDALAKVGL